MDDESLARKGLIMRLEQFPQIEVVGSCRNGKEALAAVAEFMPDLMFLDIQMPGMTGFEVVEQLQQDNMPIIVFVTAYDAFAVDAFTANAIDYLLKPIEDDRLRQAVERELGPAFRPERILQVTELPKTRSQKVVRRAVRAVLLGEDPGDLSTLENPSALESLRAVG